VVEQLDPLFVVVKFPRVGTLRCARKPDGAIPFDPKRRFAPRELIFHPAFGAGVVLAATRDRIEVDFPAAGKKTMVHARGV
jgi:hypothetical protein